MIVTITAAVSPGYIYTATASSEAIVRDVETNKLLCKANNGSQGMFVAIGGTVSITTSDPTATITQSSTTSGGARFEVHQTRPATGEEGVIYLIPITSGTDEDNEYEEWIWVKGEWERLGTTGVNLSNYATLTGANTYSGDNTFNGLLLKKNSASLGDTSVLNRKEADARYGRLEANNLWEGDQTIAAGRMLTIHPAATFVTNSIQGNRFGDGRLNFNSLHLTNITEINASNIVASGINVTTAEANTLHVVNITVNGGNTIHMQSNVNVSDNLRIHKTLFVDYIHTNTNNAIYINGKVQVNNELIANGAITANGDLSVHPNNELYVNNISGNATDLININIKELIYDVNGLELGYAYKNVIKITGDGLQLPEQGSCLELDQGIISGVKSLTNSNVDIRWSDPAIPNSSDAMLVIAPEGIKVTAPTSNLSNNPEVTISSSKVEAFQLDADVFGENKYGLRITPESCQLFGLDFAYGDRWVEPNMLPGDASSTAIQDLQLPSELDVVKIDKANISLKSTNIASLSFDYANKAYFKAFPNDGQPAIFEFVSGHNRAAGEPGPSIRLGPVDVRKASLPSDSLHKYSLLNKEEVASIVSPMLPMLPSNILVDYELFGGDTAVTDLKTVPNVNLDTAYGIAIGPSVTANVYRDIAIGGALNTSSGRGSNTLLGYGFKLGSGVRNAIVIGQGNSTSIEVSDTVFIGATSSTRAGGNNSVIINGASSGGSTVAIDGTAGDCSVTVGANSIATEYAVVVGEYAMASNYGTALGAYSVAGESELALQAGNYPAIAMQVYGGTSWETRDTTGYLRFVTARVREDIRIPDAADREEITISKSNLWSALDRAKYRGAQPYSFYHASLIGNIPALEPNSITHIGAYTSGAAIDLSGITLAKYNNTVTTAELWIEVASAGATITWPDGMLWPDETDPTMAPSFPGPEESTEVGYIMQRLYCVTLRTQYRRNLADTTSSSVLIASIAYYVDSKLLNAGAGGGGGD